MADIITWIENNTINYDKINSIVKQHHGGITTKNLVRIYNLETTGNPMTIDIFNHIIKTTQRYKNTFHNIINVIYSKKTQKWITKNDVYFEENDIYFEENYRLKEENSRLKNLLEKFTNV